MFAFYIIANFPLDWIVFTPEMKKTSKDDYHPYLFSVLETL